MSVSNALTRDYEISKIIDYSDGKKPNTIAYLEKLIGVKATKPDNTDDSSVSDIVIILGSDQVPSPSPSATPSN